MSECLRLFAEPRITTHQLAVRGLHIIVVLYELGIRGGSLSVIVFRKQQLSKGEERAKKLLPQLGTSGREPFTFNPVLQKLAAVQSDRVLELVDGPIRRTVAHEPSVRETLLERLDVEPIIQRSVERVGIVLKDDPVG